MKIKHLLTKTLLVAAGLLVGQSAWAQTVTTYDFEDGNALFTQDSRITVAVVEGTQTIYSENFDLDGKAVKFTGAGNAQNGYSFSHYDFSSLCEQAAKVKVEFETVLGNGARSIISIGDASVRGATGNSSKTTYSNKGAIFRIGTDKNNSYINGATVGGSTAVSQKWLKVTVEVDEINKKYTYSVVNKATSEELFSNGEDPISFYSSDATNCTQIDMFGYINNSQMGLIDNLVITVTKDEREQANYTVKFVDEGGNTIKDDAVRSGAVGDGITLLSSDEEAFKNDDQTKKYIFKSSDANSKTIAGDGSTIVTVTYREAATFTYTVNSNLGTTLYAGSAFEGDDAFFYIPYYLFKDGKFYQSPSLSSGSLSYGQGKLSNISENTVITATYTEEENTNVVFYAEAEDLTGITPYEDGFTNIRMSNGKVGYYESQTAFVNLPAGKYTLTSATRSGETKFYAGPIGEGTEIGSVSSGGAVETTTSNPFNLPEATDIYASVGAENKYFDYIIIRRTGDATTSIPVDIKADGSTFSSAYAIDCDKLPAGVKAYKVTKMTASEVTASEVTGQVAANTGLILKADAAGKYDIPVVASGAAVEGNLLKAAVTATPVAADQAYGLKDGKFHKLNAGTISAGKAYLLAADITSAPELNIVFGGEATGIADVRGKMEDVRSDFFDLQGRKVAQPAKGLYIQNGRKVILK